MKQYRQLYAKRYGITIPAGYEIHHIDGDRKNNDIDNLILLPRSLHCELHKIFSRIDKYAIIYKRFEDIKIVTLNNPFHSNLLGYDLSTVIELYKKLTPWITAKWFEEERIRYHYSDDTNVYPTYKNFRI